MKVLRDLSDSLPVKLSCTMQDEQICGIVIGITRPNKKQAQEGKTIITYHMLNFKKKTPCAWLLTLQVETSAFFFYVLCCRSNQASKTQ